MTRAKSGLCVACRQNDQWWDERRKIYSPFCGKTCRATISDSYSLLPLCYYCGNDAIYVGVDGENSLYCSQTCRDMSNVSRRKTQRQHSLPAQQKSHPEPTGLGLIRYNNNSSSNNNNNKQFMSHQQYRSQSAPSTPITAVTPIADASHHSRESSSKTYHPTATAPQSPTQALPTPPPSPLCFGDSTVGPAITALDVNSRDFQSVVDQFLAAWRHPTSVKGKPIVEAIYRVTPSTEVARRYEEYRNLVESQGPFYGSTFNGREMTLGNEQRRFHGTGRKCDIALAGSTQFCSDQTCGVCGIVANSFALKFFGTKTQRGRFGVGIYFSATSSKSDDYSNNSIRELSDGSNLKCMFLSKVVVGKGTKLFQSDWNRMGPDATDHSVIGEVGGVLNYDEVVVYREEACFPQYLISYTV